MDVCIPVPLHRRRQRTRGYNQAEWIARGLAEVYHFPVDTRTLVRAVDTDTQTHKSAYERRMNVAEAFRLSRPEQFVDKHVLLVDDVLTTGATLGRTLRHSSNLKVFRWILYISYSEF